MEGQVMNFYFSEDKVTSLTSEEYDREHPKWNGRFESGDMVEIDGVFMVIDRVQPESLHEKEAPSSLKILLKESY